MNDPVLDAIVQHCRERPRAVAVRDGRRVIRYGELPRTIDDRLGQLRQCGARVLAIELDNGIDWIAWDLAAAAAGIACVPMPPFFSPSQRTHVHGAAGVDAVASPSGLSRTCNDRVTLAPGTRKITFTSGTTGAPRGVCLPFDGLGRVAASVLETIGGAPAGPHFSAMPFAVLLENVAGVYSALIAGATIEAPARAACWTDPDTLLRGLADTGAATVILVPELLRGLMAAMQRTGVRLPRLEFAAVGGARVDPSLLAAARRLGLPIYEGYGLSECGSVVALNTPAADSAGTVGRPLPHVDLAVVDGEIVVRNPIGLGYLGEPRCGALRTGDLGAIDAAGFVTVTGRLRNVLITSYGRNLSPEWVEAALLAQPAVGQAVVLGDGWPRPGALVTAPDVVDDDALARAVAAANESLPDYARLGAWLRVPVFRTAAGLLTGTGRPRREAIAARYLDELECTMMRTSFYELLVKTTAEARRELYAVRQLADGLNGRISRETYLAYLAEAYHHVRHTVPLLMSMGARLPDDRQWLQEAVIEYINEEKGHEQWILHDIEAAGGDAAAVQAGTPLLPTQVLVAYNHDYIARRNPVGFLGMVFMLESTSTEIATRGATSIQGALGLPDDAFSYLYSHGSLDQEHMKFFRSLVDRITDPDDQRAIIEVACNTFRLFADVFRAIDSDTEVRRVA